MLKSRKNVFWEALLITLVIFILGFLIGFGFEASRLDRINDYYAQSEISLMDLFALNNLLETQSLDCEEMKQANLNFADRIFEEARLMERYSDATRFSNRDFIIHQRYDLMRTFLWINSLKTQEICGKDFHTVVYLYEYNTEDLAQKATQGVWSKILVDLKNKKGSEIILIPIAVNTDLSSLRSFIDKYEISSYPVVIIDEEILIESIQGVEDLERYLN